jgi:thioredoxin 1
VRDSTKRLDETGAGSLWNEIASLETLPFATSAAPVHPIEVLGFSWPIVRMGFYTVSLGTSKAGAPTEELMAGNGIVEVTDSNFDQDVLKSETPVLVDFWATWCGPCRAIAPIVEELAKDYQGRVKVGKMDVDNNSATPMRYGVRGIPTLLVFKGGQVKEQIVGYVPKETIQKAIDKHLG